MSKTFFAAISLAAAISLPAWAQSPAQQLSETLAGYENFSAEFDQLTAAQGRPTEQGSGNVLMARPDLFRWNTLEPFPQELISDGQYLWIYDPDLEQVTRRPADQAEQSAPALIFNEGVTALERDYHVAVLPVESGITAYELTPKAENSQFNRIQLYFDGNVLMRLLLEDSLEQRTSIEFHDVQLNTDLPEDAFVFTPPEGVDVLMESAANE